MKQAPYSGSTDIRSHRTKFSRPDDQAPGIRAPLTLLMPGTVQQNTQLAIRSRNSKHLVKIIIYT